MQTRSELSPIAEDRIKESQSDFKAGQLRINISWHEAESIGETHGRQSRQYLEKVLSVLSEELAYFSFIAGVHCGPGGYFAREDVINRLNGKIQDSLSTIKYIEDQLAGVADNHHIPAAEAADAVPAKPRFSLARSRSANHNLNHDLAAEIASTKARLEALKWERGSVFFNLSCVGIIDGYHEGRIEGLEQARATKSGLESQLKDLAKRLERGD